MAMSIAKLHCYISDPEKVAKSVACVDSYFLVLPFNIKSLFFSKNPKRF